MHASSFRFLIYNLSACTRSLNVQEMSDWDLHLLSCIAILVNRSKGLLLPVYNEPMLPAGLL